MKEMILLANGVEIPASYWILKYAVPAIVFIIALIVLWIREP